MPSDSSVQIVLCGNNTVHIGRSVGKDLGQQIWFGTYDELAAILVNHASQPVPALDKLGSVKQGLDEDERRERADNFIGQGPPTLEKVMYEFSLMGITFCDDLGEEEPWEVLAEPEPQYFETLREALLFYESLRAAPPYLPVQDACAFCGGPKICQEVAKTAIRNLIEESAVPSLAPAVQDERAEFRREWLTQEKVLDYRNWLEIELLKARASGGTTRLTHLCDRRDNGAT